MSVPVYSGPFGKTQAVRLLWRAGFGPRAGEAEALVKLGSMSAAVDSLVRFEKDKLKGPSPKDERGRQISPENAYGHDHLWFLDRMVRTSKPLYERMTLIWHDWFATSNDGVNSQKLMLGQNATFRKFALGSFKDLVLAVTSDPAMLLWLSGADSDKDHPNENYGRELMELFTLGADRPGGYTEDDVRNQAKALTGWTYSYKNGPTNFRFDPSLHDDGPKTIFGKTDTFNWFDSPRLCLEHPNHASYFIAKLWSYFVPTPPDAGTQTGLEQLYTAGGNYAVAPVVSAILQHPDLYDPAKNMVKPPVVYTAGILRALGRGIDTSYWVWLDFQSGQQLFYPPNVAGWNDSRWLDTASFRGRWYVADTALEKTKVSPWRKPPKGFPTTAQGLYDKAVASVGGPELEQGAKDILLQFAQNCLSDPSAYPAFPMMVYNALRQLLLTMPEAQTC